MIKIIEAIYKDDIFRTPCAGLVHCANCFVTMGSGFAKELKARFPEAFEADKNTKIGDINKLGTFSFARRQDTVRNLNVFTVFNLYSQYKYGTSERHTNYEAFYKGMSGIKDFCIENEIYDLAAPSGLGCGLGGGSWKVIYAMLEDIFNDGKVDLYIYKLK